MRRLTITLGMFLALLAPTGGWAKGVGSWPMAGHDPQSSNYNGTERVLSAASVPALHPVWTYVAHGISNVIATGARIYALVPRGTSANVLLLDAKTGKAIRSLTPSALQLDAGDTPTSLAYSHGKLIVGGGR